MIILRWLRAAGLVLPLLLVAGMAAGQEGGHVLPATPSMERALSSADSILTDAVARERIPGAVLLVTREGRVIHERAYGHSQLYDSGMDRLSAPRAMHTSTVFDLASVTKVMAATYAMMLLVDRGQVDVDAPVHHYLPEFRGPRLDSITVRHLLTHSSGLHQWQPLYYHAATAAQTYDHIRTLPLPWAVGEGRHYSDLGFMLLGYLVERVSGRSLAVFLRDELYAPLGLNSTTFLPKTQGLKEFAATSHGNPYERKMVHDSSFGYHYEGDPNGWSGWRDYTLVGEVNDGNAWYANGGVAGHAGLFSSAGDLGVLLEVLLQKGSYAGRRYLDPEVIETFTRKDRFENGLGWQAPRNAPEGSFAHGGFTGTYVIGVPTYGLGIVLLTNRQNLGVNPTGYYPDTGRIQRPVIEAILQAAQVEASRR